MKRYVEIISAFILNAIPLANDREKHLPIKGFLIHQVYKLCLLVFAAGIIRLCSRTCLSAANLFYVLSSSFCGSLFLEPI